MIERTFDSLGAPSADRCARHAATRVRSVVGVYAESTSRRPRGAVRPSPIFLGFVAVTVVGGGAVLEQLELGRRSLSSASSCSCSAAGSSRSACTSSPTRFAAYRAGDHSVEAAGYLTLNPFKYTHPLLSIVLPLYFIAQGGIGLPGGAVYLHPHAFRTRAQRSLASAVGPLVNVVFALVLLRVAAGHVADQRLRRRTRASHWRFWAGLSFLGFLQVSAAILNLLPIPGLDGYGIIEPYLSPETQRSLAPVKPWGMLGLFALLYAVPAFNQRFFEAISGVYHAVGGDGHVWAVGYAALPVLAPASADSRVYGLRPMITAQRTGRLEHVARGPNARAIRRRSLRGPRRTRRSWRTRSARRRGLRARRSA